MKNLVSGLQEHLNSGATTLCWCWRLQRADGVVQGFTDHDQPVAFDGVTYEAASGVTASELESSLGLAVDNISLLGALTSTGIAEGEIAAGLYDNANVEIWRVNWSDPGQRVLMRKGNLGEVQRGRIGFEAEVRGLAQRLNQPVGRAFGYSCDADLGDLRCTVDLGQPSFRASGAVVTAIDARRFTVSGLSAFANGWFSGGLLTWSSGANAGRAIEVKRHAVSGSAVTIELWQTMSEAVAGGDNFSVSAGCDKQFSTCKEKFGNQANFRGFPYMPGNDAAFSYPKGGETLDGKSRYGN